MLETLYAMLADGTMFQHAGATLSRVLIGFSLAHFWEGFTLKLQRLFRSENAIADETKRT